jgi:tRNA(Ile)-lysidine synthetase-like protein
MSANLLDLYDFWTANPALWFNSTKDDDLQIEKQFRHLFNGNYSVADELFNDVKQWTGYVILYDQILRHVNRVSDEKIHAPVTFVTDCYTKYNEYRESMSDFDFMWCLMPLRHTHDLRHVRFVIDESWRRLEDSKSSEIKRYLTATYERYAKLCINHDADNLAFYSIEDQAQAELNLSPEVLAILDERCNKFNTGQFIKVDDPLIQIMRDFISRNNLEGKLLTVSLSGGVDSMVCCYLLACIGQPMQAVHINYNNRAECVYEEELLINWCKMLGIPLYIRRLTEINRPKCMAYNMREVYESYTRDMRFYAYVNTAIGRRSYVMLGHNKDDCIENILTNTASQSHYENLCGMAEYSTQDHYGQPITFLRPLLATMKQDIYTFADKAHIPHLVDSTPKWSQRGKIRDIVRPALESWNPLIISGFVELSAKMAEMAKLIDTLIPETIPEFVDMDAVPKNHMYWEQIFKKQGFGRYITQKTMTCWIEKLEYLQRHPNKLVLNQPVKFVICKGKVISLIKCKNCIKIIVN